MTLRHHHPAKCCWLIVLLTLFVTGCATTSNHKFGLSFLPPAPRTAVTVEPVTIAAVRTEPNQYLSSAPKFIHPEPSLHPRPSAADLRVGQAEALYLAGQKLYDNGEVEAARAKFDAAVDLLLATPETMPERHKIEAKLEQLVAAIFRHDVNGMGLADLSQPGYDKAPLEDILQLTFPVDPAIKPRVNEQLRATVSQLPLEVNDAVLSYINFFSGERGRRTLISGLKRAGRYRELISKTLAEEGVPQELIYLAQAESGFLPRAVSHKSATGMWQFMLSRGQQYGLNRTAHYDDRLDPEKATRSAARHLKDLYEKFGDWYLAIAAYNCGDGCVDKAVQRTGYADFWVLRSRNAIPRETTNYVPIILAMTIMAKNPKAYGIENIDADPPLEYETYRVPSSTNLTLIADLLDRPVSEIRDLNPALLRNVAPDGYEVKVPRGAAPVLAARLESVPESRRASFRVHRVSEGESLEDIARRYGTTVSSLESANSGAEADAGTLLLIPDAEKAAPAAKAKSSKRGRYAATRSSKHGRGHKAAASKNGRGNAVAAGKRNIRRGVQRASLQ